MAKIRHSQVTYVKDDLTAHAKTDFLKLEQVLGDVIADNYLFMPALKFIGGTYKGTCKITAFNLISVAGDFVDSDGFFPSLVSVGGDFYGSGFYPKLKYVGGSIMSEDFKAPLLEQEEDE